MSTIWTQGEGVVFAAPLLSFLEFAVVFVVAVAAVGIVPGVVFRVRCGWGRLTPWNGTPTGRMPRPCPDAFVPVR